MNRLIDEWQSGHFIEKISVPHLSGMTPCIRLVVAGDRVLGGDASSTLAATAATEKPDVVPEWEKAEVSTPFAIVPAHEALDHYLFRLIQDAGEEGITHRVGATSDVRVQAIQLIRRWTAGTTHPAGRL